MSRKFVLIIDDLEKQKKMVADSLENDYMPLHARDIETAQRYLGTYGQKIVVIFISASMTDIGCRTFLQWLPHTDFRSIPVIALVESFLQQNEVLELGAWDFIVFPTTHLTIANRLRNILGCYHYLNGTSHPEAPSHAQIEFNNLLSSIDGGTAIVKISDSFEPVYISDGLPKLSGYLPNEYLRWLNGNLINAVYYDDRQRLLQTLKEKLPMGVDFFFSCRLYQKGGTVCWVRIRFSLFDPSASEKIAHLVVQSLERPDDILNTIKRSPLGICLRDAGTNRIFFLNDTCARLLSCENVPFLGKTAADLFSAALDNFPDTVSASEKASVSELTTKDNRQLRFTENYITRHGIPTILTYVEDITAEKHNQWEVMRLNDLLRTAEEYASIYTWEYDADTAILIEHESLYSDQPPRVLTNLPESLISDGHIHPQSIEPFRQLYRDLATTQLRAEADILMRPYDQSDFVWMHITCIPCGNESNPRKYVGIATDISEQKKQAAHYEALLALREQNPTGTLINITQDIVEQTCEEKFFLPETDGQTLAEFAQNVCASIMNEEKKLFVERLLTRDALKYYYANGETHISGEAPCRSQSGEVRILELHIQLAKDPQNGDLWCYCYITDINDHRLIHSITDKLALHNYDLILLLDINRNKSRRIGLLSKEAITYLADNEFSDYSDSIKQFCQDYVLPKRIAKTLILLSPPKISSGLKRSAIYQVNVYLKSGKIKRFAFSYLNQESGQVLITVQDITSLIEQERETNLALSDALEKAEHASTAKTEFLANMSHDMRTPLGAIIGFSEMALREDFPPDSLLRYMKKINSSGRYLMSLIDDVIDLSRIENQILDLNILPVDIKEFTAELLEHVQPLMDEANLSFRFQLKNFPEEKLILTDKARLLQIFTSVLTNAARYSEPTGKITALFECRDAKNDAAVCRFTIADNGCGMSKDFISRCFLPFEQEPTARNTRSTGTGLGLFIVKNLVELMGGNINILSEPDKGTTVIIDITFTTVASLYNDAPLFSAPLLLDGKRVLICEDHSINAEIAASLLAAEGMDSELAVNGLIGTEMFNRSAPGYYSAILMDIGMPVLDGLEATKRIRALAHPDAATIPIIAMTANDYEGDEEISLAAGMNAHLAKPIDPVKLLSVLNKLINQK